MREPLDLEDLLFLCATKAIDVREALHRLEDAAGTQLEERLVAAFVDGIKNVGDAPLPGETAPTRLWTPYAKVA